MDDSIESEDIDTLALDIYDDVTGKKLVPFRLFDETCHQSKVPFIILSAIKLSDKRQTGSPEEPAKTTILSLLQKENMPV